MRDVKGKYIKQELKQNKCITCNINIRKESKWCRECFKKTRKRRSSQEKYVRANQKKGNICIDCEKPISVKAMRCNSCNNKGSRNYSYKEIRPRDVKKYCIQCNNELYFKNTSGLCGTCVKRGKFFGKRKHEITYCGCGKKLTPNTKTCAGCISERKRLKIEEKKRIKSLKSKKRPSHAGENSWSWKGGITPLNKQIRQSLEYREWRDFIFRRDDYTCQICTERGGILNADHIKPFATIRDENNIKSLKEAVECQELWDINNGRTLCEDCYKKTDTYAKRHDLTKYKNNKHG